MINGMITPVQNVVESALYDAKQDEDTRRRNRHFAYQCVYDNTFKEYLLAIIEEINSKDSVKEALLKRVQTSNKANNIIKSTALVFESGINAKITDRNGKENDKWSNMFDVLLDKVNFEALCPEIDRLLRIHYDLAIIPKIANGKIYLDIITPDRIVVDENSENPTDYDNFYYLTSEKVNSPNQTKQIDLYVSYSRNNSFFGLGYFEEKKFKYKKVTPAEGYDNLDPVIIFRNYYPKDSFFANRENEIIECALWNGLDKTNLQKLLDFSDPLMVAKGLKSTEIPVDRTTVLALPDMSPDAMAEYISPGTDYESYSKQIDKRMDDLKLELGMSESEISGQAATSGYQLYLSKKKLYDQAKSDRVYFRNPLKQLLKTIVVLAKNALPDQFGSLPELDQFEISLDFGEQVFFMSPEEKERVRAMQLANNTKSILDFIMEDDPDLKNRDEAKKKYLRNIEENSMRAKAPESDFNDEA